MTNQEQDANNHEDDEYAAVFLPWEDAALLHAAIQHLSPDELGALADAMFRKEQMKARISGLMEAQRWGEEDYAEED